MAKIQGAAAHSKRLKNMRASAAREAGKAIFAAADALKVDAQISITTGSISGKGHIPSAPGEPPNQDTGHLANNIESVRTGPLTSEVSSNAEYSAPLEFGSERKAGKGFRSFAGKTSAYGPSKAKQGPVLVEFGDSQTAARPYMKPAADRIRPKAQKLVAEAVRRAIRGEKL